MTTEKEKKTVTITLKGETLEQIKLLQEFYGDSPRKTVRLALARYLSSFDWEAMKDELIYEHKIKTTQNKND